MRVPRWLERLGRKDRCDADGCPLMPTSTAEFVIGDKRMRRMYCTKHAIAIADAAMAVEVAALLEGGS